MESLRTLQPAPTASISRPPVGMCALASLFGLLWMCAAHAQATPSVVLWIGPEVDSELASAVAEATSAQLASIDVRLEVTRGAETDPPLEVMSDPERLVVLVLRGASAAQATMTVANVLMAQRMERELAVGDPSTGSVAEIASLIAKDATRAAQHAPPPTPQGLEGPPEAPQELGEPETEEAEVAATSPPPASPESPATTEGEPPPSAGQGGFALGLAYLADIPAPEIGVSHGLTGLLWTGLGEVVFLVGQAGFVFGETAAREAAEMTLYRVPLSVSLGAAVPVPGMKRLRVGGTLGLGLEVWLRSATSQLGFRAEDDDVRLRYQVTGAARLEYALSDSIRVYAALGLMLFLNNFEYVTAPSAVAVVQPARLVPRLEVGMLWQP